MIGIRGVWSDQLSSLEFHILRLISNKHKNNKKIISIIRWYNLSLSERIFSQYSKIDLFSVISCNKQACNNQIFIIDEILNIK